MSDLVKRLAEKREDIPGGFAMSKYMSLEDARKAEARWWLNAIAEELDENAIGAWVTPAADWLRDSASEEKK